jgi:hypothetical protein
MQAQIHQLQTKMPPQKIGPRPEMTRPANATLLQTKQLVQWKPCLQSPCSFGSQDFLPKHHCHLSRRTSIGHNMQRGNLDASRDKVVEAAKQVKIHNTNNMSFHDGHKTIVGEQGL